MLKKIRPFRTVLLFSALCTLLVSGCSFSDSSKSFSDSSSSFCKSSSGEEISEDKRQSYMNEVAVFTDSLVNTKVTSDDFMRGIARIAERYGITDWEFYKYTYIAIGRGLRQAGVSKDAIDSLPILDQMTGPRTAMKKYIVEGYDSGTD